MLLGGRPSKEFLSDWENFRQFQKTMTEGNINALLSFHGEFSPGIWAYFDFLTEKCGMVQCFFANGKIVVYSFRMFWSCYKCQFIALSYMFLFVYFWSVLVQLKMSIYCSIIYIFVYLVFFECFAMYTESSLYFVRGKTNLNFRGPSGEYVPMELKLHGNKGLLCLSSSCWRQF